MNEEEIIEEEILEDETPTGEEELDKAFDAAIDNDED